MSNARAREFALQVLYSREINPESEQIISEDLQLSESEIAVGNELVNITRSHEEIDGIIEKHLKNWSMNQLNVVDKNILRLAIAEYFYDSTEKLDRKIIINEAVELAKIYGGEKSYRFVNGILDKILKEK